MTKITGLLLLLSVLLPTPIESAVDYVDPPSSFETYDTISAVTGRTPSAALDGPLGFFPLLYLTLRRTRPAARHDRAPGE